MSTRSHAGSRTDERDAARGDAAAARVARSWPWVEGSAATLALAVLCGWAFGFLLQKGGVAKFDILIGALLLENFVVVKVMLSAIVVGMLGVHLLERRDVLELQMEETVYGTALVGGLVFGVGFALLAYCPGTDAAAVGQGNLDALVGVLGMIAGSYLYARWPPLSEGRAVDWGRRGEITLPQLLGIRRATFVAIAVPLLIAILVLLEAFGP
jgi:uncharacterized membrane protein YedE/YeeE